MTPSATCPECKMQFQPYNNRRNVIFCSYQCQVANVNRSKREKRAEAHDSFVVPCLRCGVEFIPHGPQVYCSDICKAAARRIRTVKFIPVICAACKSSFMTSRSKAKYCSPACRQEGTMKLKIARRDPAKSRETQTRYRQSNNMAVRQSRYKNWYGISLAEYDSIFSAQNGGCAICGCDLPQYGRHTHLDHKHDANQKIRGILCRGCNLGLGGFKDSPILLDAAKAYLARAQNTAN